MSAGVVDQFVQRISRGFRLRQVASASVRGAVAAGLCVASVHLVAPTWSWSAVAILGGILVVSAGVRFWRSGIDAGDADARLRLRGGLRTWVEGAREHHDRAIRGWFARELEQRIAAVPDHDVRALGRRGLGPARPALWLLLIVLLLQWLCLPPLPEGVLELAGVDSSAGAGGAGRSRGVDGSTDEAGAAATPGVEQPAPPPEPETAPPDPGRPPEEPPGPAPAAPDAPPEALLEDLPTQDELVVPSFVGAGDGVTRSVQAAGLDDAPAGRPPTATNDGAGGAVDPPPPRPAPPPDFQRALERALQSRHVRDDERPFVQRWFRSLLDEHR